jgi:hypothetical protein
MFYLQLINRAVCVGLGYCHIQLQGLPLWDMGPELLQFWVLIARLNPGRKSSPMPEFRLELISQ